MSTGLLAEVLRFLHSAKMACSGQFCWNDGPETTLIVKFDQQHQHSDIRDTLVFYTSNVKLFYL